MIRAYWFFGDTLRNGAPIPPDGEWLEVEGHLALCEWGLHASRDSWDALQYAPGQNLALVDLDGTIIEGADKLCASRRRIVARFDATDILREHARQSALSVIHLWNAPPIVREYLETGDETKRAAAWDAAWDAAGDAARAAARAAAGAAAGAAAWAAAGAAAWDAARDAARDAAWAAARAAAWAAARAAARAAAGDAASAAARSRFYDTVIAKFASMGVQP